MASDREQAQNALRDYDLYQTILDTFDIENYRPLSDAELRNLNEITRPNSVDQATLRQSREILRDHAIYKALLANFDLEAYQPLSAKDALHQTRLIAKGGERAKKAQKILRNHKIYLALLEHYAKYSVPNYVIVNHSQQVVQNAKNEKPASVKLAKYILKHDALRYHLSKFINKKLLS